MITTSLQNTITDFIQSNTVLSLTVLCADNQLWAFNAFYVFDAKNYSAYILSHFDTIHAKAMLVNPKVAGTINTLPTSIARIQGIQYQATATQLFDVHAEHAYSLYYKVFPFAKAKPAPIWGLELHYIKMTNNALGFGHKEYWQRQENMLTQQATK